ncbi:MAG: CaiB/BaiF CoA transferase family protein [Myxococcota bacterium]
MASESSTPAAGALSDLRVIEFAQALAIPYCGKVLADMGADVVKVEPPRGDTYRLQNRTHVKHEGRDFAMCNRGKRSLCLDLTHPESRDVIDQLLSTADVVLVSMKGSDLARYGIDYERLREIKPNLVYLQNSPYGSEGPLAMDGGYDVVAMGLSGMSALLCSPDESGGTPRFVRPALADIVTGMLSSLAVVTAVRHRDRTGEGQRVETSLFHTALGLISNMIFRYEELDGAHMDAFAERLTRLRAEGAGFETQQDEFREHFGGWPVGNIYFRHYRTRDGFLSVGCLSPRLNEKFRSATGLVDPRGLKGFDEDSETGKAAITLLKDEAEALFLTRDTSDWLDHLREHGVPCAQMNFPHEIFDDPQAIANGYVKDYEHHALGPYRAATTPLKMDKTPLGAPRPSPPLGAHTNEALAETGLDPEQIAKWRACGAIGRYDE